MALAVKRKVYFRQRPALCDVLACYNLARSALTGQNMGAATAGSGAAKCVLYDEENLR